MVFKLNFIKHIGSVQFWTPFVLAVAVVYNAVNPLSQMVKHYSEPVSAFTATFLFSDKLSVFLLFVGVFILFSDLPFKDNQQFFLLVRSGKSVCGLKSHVAERF